MQFLILIAVVVGVYYFFFSGPPKELPLSQYDKIYVDVYFYGPDNDQTYLGKKLGATQCGDAARRRARTLELGPQDWSYVCCTYEAGSSCYRKIR